VPRRSGRRRFVLLLELTDTGLGIMVALVAAVVIATSVGRRLDGYSISTARLSADRMDPIVRLVR
jgi:H+/Cl- antiporter ClcA